MAKERQGGDGVAEPKARRSWVKVDDYVKEIAEESWSSYWIEMSSEEALDFFQDPATKLREDGLIEKDYRVEFREVNPNQPLTVAGPPVCCGIVVFPREKIALITSYRHPEGE